jgi:hypothetical protein
MGATWAVMLLMFLMSTLAINHVVVERRLQQIEQKYQKDFDRLIDEIEYEQALRRKHREKFQSEPAVATTSTAAVSSQATSPAAKVVRSPITTTPTSTAQPTAKVPASSPSQPIASISAASNKFVATSTPPAITKPNLSSHVQAWANSKNQDRIPALIKYAHHQDAALRSLVAESLGKLASQKSLSLQANKAIATLGKLSRDRSLIVRQAAIEALGQIKSDKVLAYLMPALKDSNSAIVRSASGAIARLKYYQTPVKEATNSKAANSKLASLVAKSTKA